VKDIMLAGLKALAVTLLVVVIHSALVGVALSEESDFFYDENGQMVPCADGGCHAFKAACPAVDGLCLNGGIPCPGGLPACHCKQGKTCQCCKTI
jgi:hypothetical protein